MKLVDKGETALVSRMVKQQSIVNTEITEVLFKQAFDEIFAELREFLSQVSCAKGVDYESFIRAKAVKIRPRDPDDNMDDGAPAAVKLGAEDFGLKPAGENRAFKLTDQYLFSQ
jgi:hypothetical protein